MFANRPYRFPLSVAMLLAFLFACMACPPSTAAQPGRQETPDRPRPEVGIRGGLTFASYRGGDVENSAVTGFHLGIFGRYNLGNRFALQPEVIYVQKGADLHYGRSWKVSHDYIEMPLLLHYRFGESRLAPYVYGGPYLGFLLSSFSHQTNDLADYSPDDWVRSTTETDFGAVLGGGVEWDLGWRSFLLELRYSLGLAPVYDSGLLGDYRNDALLLSLGVTI